MLTVETEDTGAAADKDDDDDDVAVRSRLLILSRTPFIFPTNLSKAGPVIFNGELFDDLPGGEDVEFCAGVSIVLAVADTFSASG